MRKNNSKIKDKSLAQRYRRRLSIRAKISGTTERPRICVKKSNRHILVQVIDDTKSSTIFSASTFGKKAVVEAGCNRENAKLLGEKVAASLQKQGITSAVFDRAGYKFTGVIACLVNGIREKGIQI